MKPDAFWKRLETKHGQLARDFGMAVEAREDGNPQINPYALKNKSMALSLDVTGQYESSLYRDFAEWLSMGEFEAVTTILDLGCGNGVLTCLLALLFPGAKVTGLDDNGEGIEIARSIASKLEIPNIEFVAGDFIEWSELVQGASFDLVVAVKAFHEILQLPAYKSLIGHSIDSIPVSTVASKNTQTLRNVRKCLTTDGRLVALDRWSSPESFVWWNRSAEASGLRGSLNAGAMLKSAEMGNSLVLPITVMSGDDRWPVPTNEQLLAFFVYLEVNEQLEKFSPMDGAVAEAFFVSLGNKEIIASFEATYRDGNEVVKTQIFLAGVISGIYSTSSAGARYLYLAPAVAVRGMVKQFMDCASDHEAHCEVVHTAHNCESTLRQYGVQLVYS